MMKDQAPAWVTNDYLAHRDERKHQCHNFNKNPSTENKLLKDKATHRCNTLKASLQSRYFQVALAKHSGNMKQM